MPLKTIFFGTQQFAATLLKGMLDDPLFDIILIVTQPDRPTGRRQDIQKSPVKLVAETYTIPTLQPETLKDVTLPESDIAIVAQYGRIIPQRLLSFPRHGMINVHGSLLPRYRGATPIQAALINGDTSTGSTIMVMDAGMDTGPLLLQEALPITKQDTFATLEIKLAELSIPLLSQAVAGYVEKTIHPSTQDEKEATLCTILTREDGKIDWNKPAETIYHQFQGMTPWPGIWCTWEGKRLKLLSIESHTDEIAPGVVVIKEGVLSIGTGKGSLRVTNLQLEGKKSMDALTFINGFRQFHGTHLE